MTETSAGCTEKEGEEAMTHQQACWGMVISAALFIGSWLLYMWGSKS